MLPKSRFVRGVSVLMGGTVGAQFLTLLAAPILTRLYGTESFGLLSVYIAVVSLFSVVSSLKYELAIPLPEDDGDVVALTILSLVIVSLISLMAGILVFFCGTLVSVSLGVRGLSDYLWLIPVGVFLAGILQIFTYWSIRLKDFSILAKVKIWQQIVIVFVQISTFKLGGIGLLLGQAFGQGVGIQALSRKIVSKGGWQPVPLSQVKKVASRYRNFPLYSTWAGFLNTAGSQVPPLLFASIFGASAAGLYALAYRVIALPMGVVGKAVAQVFLSNAAIDYKKGKLPDLVISAQRTLIKVVVPPAIFLILFGPVVFPLVFGKDWAEAGEVASWLALWMLVSFAASPLSSIFAVIERQGLGLLMQGFLFAIRVCGIAVGIYYQDFMVGVIWFSISNVFGYIVYQVVAFQSVGLSVANSLKGYILVTPIVIFSLLIKDSISGVTMVIVALFGALLSIAHYYKVIKGLMND